MGNLSDEELVKLSRSGDKDATNTLMERYKGLVRKNTNRLYLIGGDTEDLIQEGMIGLFNAINTFDASKNASFKTFAEICIKGQMSHAIEAANRFKHIPLNSYISFDIEIHDGEGDTLGNTLEDSSEKEPLNQYIDKENVTNMLDLIKGTLSKMEFKVFVQYINGRTYKEIAKNMNKTDKSIDNALNRIKRKISALNVD